MLGRAKGNNFPGSDGGCVAKEPFLDGERASSKPEDEKLQSEISDQK